MQTSKWTFFSAVLFGMAAVAAALPYASAQDVAGPGLVRVHDQRLLRDGQPWTPHGFFQIAFAVPPGAFNIPGQNQAFVDAYKNYLPTEYAQMRAAGADSVRMNVAQDGVDFGSGPYGDPAWVLQVIDAVRAARRAGLTVILSIQDETQTGVKQKAELPNDGTRRVWALFSLIFGRDQGVLFELYNEPNLHPNAPVTELPSAADWAAWAAAMNETIEVVRLFGAHNVVVADGLASAQQLTGAPQLADASGQFAYASHPYPGGHAEEQPASWDQKFGDFAATAPVIVTEWGVGYYCDGDTPDSVVRFLSYLQQRQVGLEAVAWDWGPYNFASAVQGFPGVHLSSLLVKTSPAACTAASGFKPGEASGPGTAFGPGEAIHTWYTTGAPPTEPE